METKDMELLGLNSYEAKIYLSLIENPESTASEISRNSGVPQNRVYDVVEGLITKKFVFLIPGDPKRFSPEDPKHLKHEIDEQLKRLKKLDERFEELHKTYVRTGKQQKVIVTRTGKNFDKIVAQLPPSKTFSYAVKPRLSTSLQFLKGAKKRKDHGVRTLTIADNKFKDSPEIRKWRKIEDNFKFIDTKGVLLSIDDHGVIISLLPPENESLVIYVENVNLATIMKAMFSAYYEKLI